MFKKTNFVFFLVVTLIWVIIWIGFNIYHDFTTSTVSEELQQAVSPLNGTFDQTEIHAIEQRKQVTPLYIFPGGTGSSSASTLVSPTPTLEVAPTTIPETTTTPEVTQTPTSTPPAVPTPTGG